MSSQKENTRVCCMCGSSPAKDPSITLHRFPKPGSKNILRCELWAKYCFPDEAWASSEFQNELHSKHKMLCSKHFGSTCFNGHKLFKTAVPGGQCNKDTINANLPDQPALFELLTSPFTAHPLNKHYIKVISQRTNLPNQSESVAGPSTDDLTKSGLMCCKCSKQNYQIEELITKLKRSMNKEYRLQKTVKYLKKQSFLNVICNDATVKKILNKNINSTFALLLQVQLQNYRKKRPGRRWNKGAKIIASRLCKRSPNQGRLYPGVQGVRGTRARGLRGRKPIA